MNLCIDIGNTRTKWAVYDGDRLRYKEATQKLMPEMLEEMAYNQKAEKAILSSVAAVDSGLEDFLKKNYRYLRLTEETPLPFALHYKTPETLGRDRIAAAAGAFGLFPGENCLVIDAGTCITADIVSSTHGFMGGNIAPGLEMRLAAMHHFTAKLPLVKRENGKAPLLDAEEKVPYFLGQSTEHAIWNGGMLGAVWELQGFIRQCRKQFRPLRVIITGGDADFFAGQLKTRIFAHPNLVLYGLNKILQHNVEKLEGI